MNTRHSFFLRAFSLFLMAVTAPAIEAADPPFGGLAGHWFNREGGISLNLKADGRVNIGTFGVDAEDWSGRLEWSEAPVRLRGSSHSNRSLSARSRGRSLRLVIDYPDEFRVPLRLQPFDGDRLRMTGRFKGVSLEMIQPVALAADGSELLGEWVERGRDGSVRWVEIRTFAPDKNGTYRMKALNRRERSYIDRQAPFIWDINGRLLMLAFGDDKGFGFPIPHLPIEVSETRLTIFNQASGVVSAYERSDGAELPETPQGYDRAPDPAWGFGAVPEAP